MKLWRKTYLGIENAGECASVQVRRNELILSVSENSLVLWRFRGTLDLCLDLVVGCTFLETASQVDNRDVVDGNTESHTSELAVQGRDDLADSLGSTSAGRDNVVTGRTATTPVLATGTVNGLLGGSSSVAGGHETFKQTELVVDDLGKRCKAVGGAAGVGNDRDLGVVGVQVDTYDVHGSVCGRSRDDNLLGTTLDVRLSLVGCGEHTCGLNNVSDTALSPGNLRRVTLAKDSDGLAIDDQLAVLGFDGALEVSVCRVI